jgi:uncharacterized protein (TIRG00374 family)
VLIGLAIGGVALWLALRGTDRDQLVGNLSKADPALVAVSLALVAATVAVSAERWRRIAFPSGGGRYRHFLSALVAGQMLNSLLPIRLGEVSRIYAVSRDERLPFGRVAATVVAERVLDVVALGVSVSWLLVQVALPPWMRQSGEWALSLSGTAMALVFMIAKCGGALRRAIERRSSGLIGSAAGRFLARQGDVAVTQIEELVRPSSATVWLLSMVIVMLAAATNLALFRAFGIGLPPAIALLLFVVLQVGGAPVATPGNVGVVHLLTVVVLTAFGVDRTAALAYAVMLHLVAFVSKIVAGTLALAVNRTPLPGGWT